MASIYPAALSHFAVFCPALGPSEDTTHEQLLFYAAAGLPSFYPHSPNDYFARNMHLRRRSSGEAGGRSPPSRHVATGVRKAHGATETAEIGRERVVSLDTKLREIGLGAALITFGQTFGGNGEGLRRFHTVHSEKRRTIIYQPESGVLVQLAVVLPRRVKPYGREKDAYSIEFLDGELSDQALRAWLEQEYAAFCLLFGQIGRRVLAARGGREEKRLVKRQLDAYFGKTLWHWDRRWDPRIGAELELLHALQPMPLLPVGSISLGGFDEFWRDLSSLAKPTGSEEQPPLVHAAAVLWRGKELVWCNLYDSEGPSDPAQCSTLRALVSWSRAVYAPVFDSEPTERKPSPRGAHTSHPGTNTDRSASPLSVTAASSAIPEVPGDHVGHQGGGWSLPGSNWLWNWGGGSASANEQPPARTGQPPLPPAAAPRGSESDRRSSVEETDIVRGGISQVLSRAVNALVEPRPPTPPEVDPVFAAGDGPGVADQYGITAEDIEAARGSNSHAPFARDSDVESLQSVGSLASVRTARTTATASVALNRSSGVGRASLSAGQRNRSNTALAAALASGWQPEYMRRGRHGYRRAPSIASNVSAMTAESTQHLRADTRVSSRSWWPSGWTWGGSSNTSKAVDPHADPEHADDLPSLDLLAEDASSPSGVDPETTFLYTGEFGFPGLPQTDNPQPVQLAAPEASDETSDEDTRGGAKVSELELAMGDELPAAYQHGVDVDCARGVVLAPRGISGMLYSTRLLRLMFHSEGSAAKEPSLHMGPDDSAHAGGSRTLAYKFGDMLFVVFGPPQFAAPPPQKHGEPSVDASDDDEQRRPRRFRRRRGRRGRRAGQTTQVDQSVAARPFASAEALAIESAILRYAESLQAATRRDREEVEAQRQSEVHLAQRQRRIPPYVFQMGSGMTFTSWPWQADGSMPANRSFAGYVDGDVHKDGPAMLPAGVRQALAMVSAEATSCEGSSAVCVRMQDKGWVAGSSEGPRECYCVVDQPQATLADAQSFLSRISRRALSLAAGG
ncbi:hypothetical protein GGF46_002459 [Coemansia sp. RSA 552]|nr:hypothetical protein GGF46_002459 [Coemansia sp. RSA 552]